jgi:transcriptional regulator with XRE-family HTH domain
MINMGDSLKNARIKKGLTQKELAELIGAKNNSISNWEKNQNKPDPDTIEILCGALGISTDKLLYGFEKSQVVKLIDAAQSDRTVEQFAEDTGVDLDYIEKLRKGDITEPPTPEIIKKIMDDPGSQILSDYIELMEAAGYYSREEAKRERAKQETAKLGEAIVEIMKGKYPKLATLAASRTDGYEDDLPKDAVQQINDYVDLIKMKYKKKDSDK